MVYRVLFLLVLIISCGARPLTKTVKCDHIVMEFNFFAEPQCVIREVLVPCLTAYYGEVSYCEIED